MCGLVGFISSKHYGAGTNDAKTFWNLLLADTVRGVDGTGMYWQDDDGKQWYYKDAVPAAQGFTRYAVDDFIDSARFAVGHNRAATLGSIDKDHTHPFVFENVIGAHNGTIQDWKKLGDVKTSTMDSMAVFELLDRIDPNNTTEVTELLADIGSGAYTLVWHDNRINKLCFARNNQRPMHMVLTTGGDLWFGSELRMLQWCLHRNDIKMKTSWGLDATTLLRIDVTGKEAPESHRYTANYGSSWGNSAYGTGGSNYWTGYGYSGAGYQTGAYQTAWKDLDDDTEDAQYTEIMF